MGKRRNGGFQERAGMCRDALRSDAVREKGDGGEDMRAGKRVLNNRRSILGK